MYLGTPRHAAHEGRADAKAGIPHKDWAGKPPPSEEALTALGGCHQSQVGIRYYKQVGRIEERRQAAYRELVHSGDRVDEAGYQLTKSTQREELLVDRFASESRRGLARWVYFVFLMAAAVAELPLNNAAFLLLGESPGTTRVMAIALTATILTGTHILGLLLARLGSVVNKQSARLEAVAAWVIGITLGVAICALGLLRITYVRAVEQDLGITVGRGTAIPFILLQLAIASVATFGSFLVHNESADVLASAAWKRRLASLRVRMARRNQTRSQLRFVVTQARADTVFHSSLEESDEALHHWDFLRYTRRSNNIRNHPEGPDPSLLPGPLAPIEAGAWTRRSMPLYRFSADADDRRPLHQVGEHPGQVIRFPRKYRGGRNS